MEYSGEERFENVPEEIWDALTNPEFLCQCFPGVDRVAHVDSRSATVVVRPGFSFIRGTLEVKFEFGELNAPVHGDVSIELKGIGISAWFEARFQISPCQGGSRVAWSVREQELGGLLKAVSPGLIQAAGQKVALDTWSSIRSRLSPLSGTEGPAIT